MNELKETLLYLLQKEDDVNVEKMCKTHYYVSLIMAITAFVMTVQNIRTNSMDMAIATTIIVIGMLLNIFHIKTFNNYKVSCIILSVLSGIILSVFVIVAGNQGFACLWTLLVPLLAIPLVGVIPGTALCFYFLIFIILIFYTPLNYLIMDKYTTAHMQRFPVLYACDMASALFISLQREYYLRKFKEKSFFDELTGAFNRNFFLNQMERAEIINSESLTIIMIDLNGLKAANDTRGHQAGDELLMGVVEICKKVFGSNVNLFRMGGDEFAIILSKPTHTIIDYISLLTAAKNNWKGKLNDKLEFAIGYATKEEFPEAEIDELIKIADERMYADKANFYKQHDRRVEDPRIKKELHPTV